MLLGLLEHFLILLILIGGCAIFVFPWWKIFAKAGFPGPLALLMWVPVVNLVLLFWLALARWPNQINPGDPPQPTFCPSCGTALN